MATTTQASKRTSNSNEGRQSRPAPRKATKAVEAETENSEFGLVSVLYHALQGIDTSRQYIEDAQEDDDEELAQFFVECGEQYRKLAVRAKTLLGDRIEDDTRGSMDDEDDEEES